MHQAKHWRFQQHGLSVIVHEYNMYSTAYASRTASGHDDRFCFVDSASHKTFSLDQGNDERSDSSARPELHVPAATVEPVGAEGSRACATSKLRAWRTTSIRSCSSFPIDGRLAKVAITRAANQAYIRPFRKSARTAPSLRPCLGTRTVGLLESRPDIMCLRASRTPLQCSLMYLQPKALRIQ